LELTDAAPVGFDPEPGQVPRLLEILERDAGLIG
jgi:hypothetical protein